MVSHLFDNLLVLIIIISLMIIIYCRVTRKTVKDLIIEIKEANEYEADY